MKLFRKVLGFPFAIIGVPLMGISLAINFGLANANKMLESFVKTVDKYKDKE